MASDLDYLSHLTRESARFVDVLQKAAGDARVPTCPDWDADDLLWHLGEVQWFWASVVRDAVEDPGTLVHPDRPGDRAGLVEFFTTASAELQQTLRTTPPEAVRWTWSEEQTAGFTRRRQAHEALIHRVDAELTARAPRAAMDAQLSSDGIDEALRIMFSGVPPWGRTVPEPGATLRIRTGDTDRSWLVTLGRFTGTDPDGKEHDLADILVAVSDPGDRTAATLTGAAADLDCWLWGRPGTGALDRSGDEAVLTRFQAILDQGVD